ncbi:MAG TPA: outer membrane protein assembly factor BamA, partial [Bryobacteraceae bacterium]|nr:outer membrane protein assembly factor BamA [Bryobacteraceae bacterium]
MSTRLGWWVSVSLLAILSRVPVSAAPEQYDGKTITGIQFDPEKQPLPTDQLIALLPLRPGEPLSSSGVRDAIQRLYATGEYVDIAVDATLGTSGVNLKFLTKPSFFVGHVGVTGVPEPPNEGQLVVATRLQLGAEYSEGDLNRAVEQLVDVARRNGLYNAMVMPQTSFNAITQQVDIDFNFDAGTRAKFDGVLVTGTSERSTESIVKSARWKRFPSFRGWQPVTENRVQNGVDNVRSWYPKHNRLLAKVTLENLDYHEGTNTVTPRLNIQSGPPVDVRVRGVKISAGRLRSILPIYEERTVDRDLLNEGNRDLATYLESQGYFDAKVSYSIAQPPNGSQLIDYDIDKGVRHKIVKLAIEGNHYFDEDTIRERMNILPATFLRYRYGRFREEYLEHDLNSIRDLYRSNGFRDVEVTAQKTDDYQGKNGQIAIFIQIKEGPQWFVSKLSFRGVATVDESALRLILQSTAGQPYSDLSVASDRDAILDYYFNNGYAEAKFEFTSMPAEQPNHVNLEFVVTAGGRLYVRDVLVSGLYRTKPELVRSRINLKPGDPLSQDRITGSQRRLYDLGIFARVNAAIQNPDGSEPTKYVLYSAEEAKRYSMNFGFGAEIGNIGGGTTTLTSPAGTTGFSPRFLFGISRLNFLGVGHTVSLQSLLSTLEQRAVLTYLAPQFEGNPNFSLQLSGIFDISHNVRTFSARREEGSVQFAQKLSRANTIQYRYTFRKVNIIGTPLVSRDLIPLLSQPVRVGFLSTTFVQDRRDDPLDAHHGIYNTVDLQVAANVFGSQTGYARVLAQNSTYYQLTKSLVLARSTTFGVIRRYAGLPEIPLPERFFAGGSLSNRAFPDFQAGPRDLATGFPIGGNALLTNSIELRFPLIGDNFGGVLFNDLGNVYDDVKDISLRFRQRNLQDFNYAVQGFGFGIRYRTPIVPVRADFSLSPNSPRFVGCQGSIDQILYCGSTNPPPGVTVPPIVTQR